MKKLLLLLLFVSFAAQGQGRVQVTDSLGATYSGGENFLYLGADGAKVQYRTVNDFALDYFYPRIGVVNFVRGNGQVYTLFDDLPSTGHVNDWSDYFGTTAVDHAMTRGSGRLRKKLKVGVHNSVIDGINDRDAEGARFSARFIPNLQVGDVVRVERFKQEPLPIEIGVRVPNQPTVSDVRVGNVANNRHRVLFSYFLPEGADDLRITVYDAGNGNAAVRFNSRNVTERIFNSADDGGETGITIDRNRPDNSRYILRVALNRDRTLYSDTEIGLPIPDHFSDIHAWGTSITNRGLVDENTYRIVNTRITYNPNANPPTWTVQGVNLTSQSLLIDELNFIGEDFFLDD